MIKSKIITESAIKKTFNFGILYISSMLKYIRVSLSVLNKR